MPASAANLTDLLARASVAIGNKDFVRAIEIYSEALGQPLPDDKRRDLLLYRATAFDLAKQTERAEADYTAAVKLGNPDAPALRDRGFFYLNHDRIDSALEDFEAGARLAPNDAVLAYGQGRVFSARRQYAAAIEHYSKAISLDPKTGRYWLWRGESLVLSKRLREGIADYDKAIAAGLNRHELGQLRAGRGHAYLQLQEVHAAIADFDAVLALNASNANVLRMRGQAFESLGAADKARADYERVLSLRPNDTWVKDRLQQLRRD